MRPVRLLVIAFVVLLATTPLLGDAEGSADLVVETDLGAFKVVLFEEKAPVTVANFLGYVRRYYYDGLIFHRVVDGFVIQSGGYTFDLHAKEPGEPIANESDNGLRNRRGTLAMARHDDPDSARAQFFINLADNSNLDPDGSKAGYTVFGEVVEGMDVVDAIGKVEVGKSGRHQHLPLEPVRILSIREIAP